MTTAGTTGSTPPSRFNVSADDLRKYDWQERIAKCSGKECSDFREVLHAAASEREAAGDDLGGRVFNLLALIASLFADYDAKGIPYRERLSTHDGKRSLNTDDLVPADFSALRGIVDETKDTEYRGRLADILWECTKDFKCAQLAVRSFLESAERLNKAGEWIAYAVRLERAAKISARKGFEPLEAEVVAAVENGIVTCQHDLSNEVLTRRLMTILLRLHVGDAKKYAALSEQQATAYAKAENWHASEQYWDTASSWHRVNEDEAAALRCLATAAECHVSAAEANTAGPQRSYSFASAWMGKALEALRRAKADPARIAHVHRRLLELQKLALTEMGPVSLNFDEIPGLRANMAAAQQEAADHVRGQSFERALGRFATISHPTNFAALKAQVLKQSEDTIFDKIITQTKVDRGGKVADTLDPSNIGAPLEGEALRKRMVQLANEVHWPLQVTWNIEPARIALVEEHAVRRDSLRFLVSFNPYIPRGHEGIFLRGIQAGFQGDWLVAMHLLVPQVEALIRHAFQQNGAVTSTLESDGTQKERDLNQLLWMPDMEIAFGPDVSFDLRGILIERFGHNLRNESAHGLMPEGAFYGPASLFLWWLVIHLCWTGQTIAAAPPPPGAPQPPAS